MIRFYLIFIFLYAQFITNQVAGQVNESALLFKRADSLYVCRQYRDAAIEYERIIFKNKSNKEKSLALLKKARCYKQINQFISASNELDQTSYRDLDDSIIYQIRYEKALSSYLNRDFNNAESQLIQILYLTKDTNLVKQSLLLRTLNLNQLNLYDTAYTTALRYIKSSEMSDIQKEKTLNTINQMYSKPPRLKKEKTARLLSSFIPGSGQVYAGAPIEGLFNFSLHVATLGFAVYEFLDTYYITGYFAGLGMFQKFYFGGIRRAEYLVKKKNYQVTKKFNEEVKNILIPDHGK
jgi:hypothetical protein